ncbi:MAG: hypothetical protein K2P17_03655 [Helicobacteraceae bacterium]|nr:hypothetical protein [Helicobacteraceae bacterium]
MSYILFGICGRIDAVLRYNLVILLNRILNYNINFITQILLINAVGCLVAGILIAGLRDEYQSCFLLLEF